MVYGKGDASRGKSWPMLTIRFFRTLRRNSKQADSREQTGNQLKERYIMNLEELAKQSGVEGGQGRSGGKVIEAALICCAALIMLAGMLAAWLSK